MSIQDIPNDLILFFTLYGGGTLVALVASIYLCMRRGNAFAPDITPPMPLRRWAASFFAVASLGHIWWYLFYIYSGDIHSVSYLVAAMLDCVGLLTTIAGTLFAMLQDRKRPVWPLVIATIPYAVLLVLNIAYPSGHFIYIAIAYFLLLYALFSIYMVFAVRQYGRWLRDNFADLERKEVWMSHMLVIVLLLSIITYGFDGGNLIISYLVQLIGLVLTGLLLWRVETLPDLGTQETQETHPHPVREGSEYSQEQADELSTPLPTREGQGGGSATQIERMLAEHCVGTQLYLQHDLTVQQLAHALGTNRSYLSQYFSSQGTTYNAYINDLRINYFMRLYREASQARQPITAQQLASKSGYRSYSTFSLAFKQRMGQSVTAWTRKTGK